MGFAELIKNPDLQHPEMINYASVIERNSEHLLRIIDDILDLSKVEAGKMQIESIDFSLADLLADFSSLMAFRAREKGIHFELKVPSSIPDKINSDPTRIRQILVNIVGNAIKFTEQGHVRLTVILDQLDLRFEVSDTGTGMSREQCAKLFQPFHQADISTTRKFGGTGLGLVLTRSLSEAMGGEFNLLFSAPGQGSRFESKIRIQIPKNSRTIAANTLKVGSEKMDSLSMKITSLIGSKVLIIEDSPDNQVLLRMILTKLGMKVEIASDGIEGMQMALAQDFDLILCDIQMPRMDGHQTVRELKGRGYKKPIVALTAHAMKEERDRALASGFDSYLTKPIQRNILVDVLLEQLNRNQDGRA